MVSWGVTMKAVINYVKFRDYKLAKDKATEGIIKRQSRGNVAAQKGWAMTQADLRKKSIEADHDVEYISQALKRA